MSLVSRLTSRTALLLCLGTALSAQDAMTFQFKMGGGPLSGQVRKVTGDAGYSFSGTFELNQKLSSESALVYGLGYRAFPGDFQNLSFIPNPRPNQPVGLYTYESRVRKGEASGFHLSAMYRKDMFMEGMYLQGGLVLGFYKSTTTDTGTRLTVNVTTANTSGTVTKTETINSRVNETATSLGLTGGLGFRFNDRYTLELNLIQSSLEGVIGKKSGIAAEVAFGVRF